MTLSAEMYLIKEALSCYLKIVKSINIHVLRPNIYIIFKKKRKSYVF